MEAGPDTFMQNEILPPSKVDKLRKRADFLRLRKGRRYSAGYMTLQAGPTISDQKTAHCRVGYTVTNKVGNAVVRSRIKRRLRDAARLAMTACGQSGHDYVIIARRAALDAEFAAIVQEMKLALDHVHGKRAKGLKRKAYDR